MAVSQSETHTKLQEAIRLIKAGRKTEARALLMAVLAVDEHNELAWLWLSAVVDNNHDRITALQNALTINPQNEKARARLIAIQANQQTTDEEAEGGYEPTPAVEPSHIAIQSYSNFDDVWTHAEHLNLCAYCAQEVDLSHKRCPQCRRKLAIKTLSFAHVSAQFHMYWVLILSLCQLMAIQVVIDLLSSQPRAVMIVHGAFVPVFLVLPVLLYRRIFWAYLFAQITLFVTAGLLISASMFPTLITSLSVVVGTPLEGLYDGATLLVGYSVRFLQTVAAGLAFFLGAFFVGPDFSRDTIWLYARVNKELRGNAAPSRAHAAAERYVKRGMWATAVLHWRRAQGGAPTELRYYLRLAEGYNRLGFYKRALDTIESGLKIAAAPETRRALNDMKRDVIERLRDANSK